jgi:ABC-type multidrug transport system ATPase subunit
MGLDVGWQAKLDICCQYVYSPRAVVITSQHLREIEAISDQVILLDGGQLRFSGAVSELASLGSVSVFKIKTASDATLRSVATELGAASIKFTPSEAVILFSQRVSPQQLFDELSKRSVAVRYFEDISGGIEAVMFFSETGASNRGPHP